MGCSGAGQARPGAVLATASCTATLSMPHQRRVQPALAPPGARSPRRTPRIRAGRRTGPSQLQSKSWWFWAAPLAATASSPRSSPDDCRSRTACCHGSLGCLNCSPRGSYCSTAQHPAARTYFYFLRTLFANSTRRSQCTCELRLPKSARGGAWEPGCRASLHPAGFHAQPVRRQRLQLPRGGARAGSWQGPAALPRR